MGIKKMNVDQYKKSPHGFSLQHLFRCFLCFFRINRGYNLFTVRVLFFFSLPFYLLSSGAIFASEDVPENMFSLEFRETEVRDVLKFLARESGRNIIIPDELTQKVTLSLDGITLDDALEVILKSYGLLPVTEKGVIRIVKRADTDGQMSGELLSTEIITLNYASATALLEQAKGLISSRGSASVDERSNSLIIKDVGSVIDDIRALLEKLDYRVPQVLIKARIVEAGSSFSRNLGIQWGGRYVNNDNILTGGAGLSFSPGGNNYAVDVPVAEPTSGLGMTIGSIGSSKTLDIQLSAAQGRGDLTIVSTPSITTVNNKPATISSGLEYKVRTSTIAGGTQTDTGTESVTAETSLTVTPQVSSDNHILLIIEAKRDELDFTREVDNIPGKIKKSAKTTVLIKDGDTTVIGGLYKTKKGKNDKSVPFLSKIPILGWLFKSQSKEEEKEELLIFITPQIIRDQT